MWDFWSNFQTMCQEEDFLLRWVIVGRLLFEMQSFVTFQHHYFAQMSPLRWHARYKPSHRWGECHISSVVSSSFVHAFSKINTKLSHFHSSSKYVHIDKRVWICNQGDHDETRGASQRKRAGGLKLLIPECMYVLQSQPQCMKITKKVSFYSMWRWK